MQNALRYEVAKFSNENKRLGKSIEDLKVKVFCLNETKQRLKELTQDQNLNVNALVELVHENQRIIDAKKKTLIVGIQQDLMESLLKADNDFSGDFSEREIKRMLNYLRGLPSVKVNEQLIAQAIKNDNCIVSMMNLVRAITKVRSNILDHAVWLHM